MLVFVPTLNDRESLPRLLVEIHKKLPGATALVIDDGSSPPISAKELPSGCLLVHLPANYGLGVATSVACDLALARNLFPLVRLDADGQHPVDRIRDLVAPIERGNADIVFGCRANRNQRRRMVDIPGRLVRGYISRVGKVMTLGRTPDDLNSGFLALGEPGVRVLSTMLLERYPEPQIALLAAWSGLRIGHIDVEQLDRHHGRSSIGLRQGLQMFYRFNLYVLSEFLGGRR